MRISVSFFVRTALCVLGTSVGCGEPDRGRSEAKVFESQSVEFDFPLDGRGQEHAKVWRYVVALRVAAAGDTRPGAAGDCLGYAVAVNRVLTSKVCLVPDAAASGASRPAMPRQLLVSLATADPRGGGVIQLPEPLQESEISAVDLEGVEDDIALVRLAQPLQFADSLTSPLKVCAPFSTPHARGDAVAFAVALDSGKRTLGGVREGSPRHSHARAGSPVVLLSPSGTPASLASPACLLTLQRKTDTAQAAAPAWKGPARMSAIRDFAFKNSLPLERE